MPDKKGYITVNVRTAGGALPVSNAMITVSSDGGGIVAVMFSDISGTSDIIELDAPPVGNSLSPDAPGDAASLYTIVTDKEGFYRVVNTGVPVYSGVKSIQQVLLVPTVPGLPPTPEELTRFNNENLPDL